MTSQKLTREEYLSKDFDYTKLTKQEMRAIMSENGVEDIPPLTALKSTIIEAYKKNIHDRIDSIKSNFSEENIFQGRKGESRPEDNILSPSFSAGDKKDKSFDSENGNLRDIPKPSGGFAKKSLVEESSEINSTAFNKKSKASFIAIPKRREAEESTITNQNNAMNHDE
ncbi:uncharacterized protein VICG_02051 [Vittaforma corneae ATCC 50505]|uniref:Uncharacterized protein n=1 Tax=Vittaforma corneae (strain ATCC 50505) TaxID=993615 RepID=L2GJ70_VITCO|nr:uncharacterized protein VICG_02051 [Vittaforma corneae ATCC 50505]ELA40911.1 hypothetical protein VICG_02051 [Vittaforma corneae ATCC 50505]